MPGIWLDEQVAGWQKVTAAVHAAGGKIVCQFWHVGRFSHTSLLPGGAAPVASSALRAEARAAGQFQAVQTLAIPDKQPLCVYLRSVQQAVLVTRQVFTNQDGRWVHRPPKRPPPRRPIFCRSAGL